MVRKSGSAVATIKDVAAQAGVSQSTVHYALNGKRPISDSVRARVMAAVAALDYSASSIGQRMRERRSYSIGLVAPPLPASDAAMMEILVSTAATASRSDYTLGIFMGQTPTQILQLLRQQFVDGLILVETTHLDPRVEALRETEYPFVMIGRTGQMEGLASVDFDFESAIFEAFAHLAELGHRTIGFIAPPPPHDPNLENRFSLERGYRRALQTYEFRCVRKAAELDIAGGFQATQELLDAEPQLTSIVVTGHAHVGVLRALYSRKLRAPDDLSVVSITTEQVAGWTTPPLTSVDMPLSRMGEVATELLLRKLSGETVTDQVLMPARLIHRDSSAAPKR